jgi:hypothetical protein
MQYRLANVTPFVKLVWVALAAGLTCLPVTAAGQVRGDFNGDGFDDLALGVPGEDVRDAAFNNIMDAGAVSVIYGSPVGLSATSVPNQFWHQGSDGVPDLDEALDGFGSSLAAGDFNADGFDDLAIGVPGEDVGIVVDAGAVTVLYGSVFGLTSVGSQTWHQNSSGILGVSRRNDQFGFALAAGDFDDDGYEDLAAGIPFKVVGGKANVGAISVLHGSVNGISARDQYLENDNLAHDANSRYGFALAVGKFSGDGTDDLAIGAPGDDRGGAVYFVEGRLVGGLARSFHTIQSRDLDDRGAGDEFGFALAAGDFNGDSRADVAVGVPNTSSGGMLEIIYFTLEGVSRCVVRGTTCHVTHLLTDPVVGDAFGFALAVGNFNQSGGDDIAVSAPTREVGNIADAGVVAIL